MTKTASDLDPRLGTRARRGLLRAGISTHRQFMELTSETLANIRNIGKKTVEEILSLQQSGPLVITPEDSHAPPASAEITSSASVSRRAPIIKTTSSRDQRLIDSYLAGALTEEITKSYGITRQRVSQILKRHGIRVLKERRGRRSVDGATLQLYVDALFKFGSATKAGDALGVSGSTIRRAYRNWSSSQLPNQSRSIEAISKLFRSYKALYMSELSSSLNVAENEVKFIVPKRLHKFIIDLPNVHETESATKWTREKIIDGIRRAGTYYFPLTRKAYDDLILIGEIEGPSSGLIYKKRFGTWNELCAEAGIDSIKSVRNDYSRKWSQQELLGYVQRFLIADDTVGSAQDYEAWSKKQVELCPSIGTLSDAFGGWHQLKREALIGLRESKLEVRADGI